MELKVFALLTEIEFHLQLVNYYILNKSYFIRQQCSHFVKSVGIFIEFKVNCFTNVVFKKDVLYSLMTVYVYHYQHVSIT